MSARLVLVAAVMVLAGCSDDAPPTSPPPASVTSPAGNWSGSISDAISGDGTAQLSLTEQAPNTLTGTWSVTFKNGDRFLGPAAAGLFASTGYGVVLSVEPVQTCSGTDGSALIGFALINVAITPSRLTAVTGRISCNGTSFGTVNLAKQ